MLSQNEFSNSVEIHAAINPTQNSDFDEIQSMREEDSPPTQENVHPWTCHCLITHLLMTPVYTIAFMAPVSSALNEAAYTAMSVYASENVDPKNHVKSQNVSIYVLVFTSGITFLSSFQYNNRFRSSNTALLLKIARSRKPPQDWPVLSKTKEWLALLIALVPISWAAMTESSQTYFSLGETYRDYQIDRYVNAIAWKTIKSFFSFCSGLNAIFGAVEIWRILRSYFAGKQPHGNHATKEMQSKLSYFLTIPLSALNGLNALQNGIYILIAIESDFDTRSLWQRSIIGSACLLTVIGNLCTEGPFVINFAERIYNYLKLRKVEPIKMITALSTVATSATLAYYTRFLVEEFYNHVAQDYDFDGTPHLTQVFNYLSWILALQQILSNTASLYDIVDNLVNSVINSFKKLYQNLHAYLCSPSKDIENKFLLNDEKEVMIELDVLEDDQVVVPESMHQDYRSFSSNPNGLFHHAETLPVTTYETLPVTTKARWSCVLS